MVGFGRPRTPGSTKGPDVPRQLPVLVTAAVAAAVSAGVPATAAAPPTSAAPCATGAPVVRIDGLAFNPPSVTAGGTSAATLTATNCTGQSQTVSATWAGRFLSDDPSTGYPAGCPVVDPLAPSVAFAPYAQVATTTAYLVFPGCTADRFRLTVTLSQGGVLLDSRTAELLIG